MPAVKTCNLARHCDPLAKHHSRGTVTTETSRLNRVKIRKRKRVTALINTYTHATPLAPRKTSAKRISNDTHACTQSKHSRVEGQRAFQPTTASESRQRKEQHWQTLESHLQFSLLVLHTSGMEWIDNDAQNDRKGCRPFRDQGFLSRRPQKKKQQPHRANALGEAPTPTGLPLYQWPRLAGDPRWALHKARRCARRLRTARGRRSHRTCLCNQDTQAAVPQNTDTPDSSQQQPESSTLTSPLRRV